jgi:hypothetical protein
MADKLQRAIDDLRRFERRMALAYLIFAGMFFFGLLGLLILKVIQ